MKNAKKFLKSRGIVITNAQPHVNGNSSWIVCHIKKINVRTGKPSTSIYVEPRRSMGRLIKLWAKIEREKS